MPKISSRGPPPVGARGTKGGARTGDPRRRGGATGAARDPWSRLKALNDLRSTGALTRAEFDALKADLALSEPDDQRKPAVDRVALIRQLADQRASGALSTEEFEARKRSVMLGRRVEPPGRARARDVRHAGPRSGSS
ncbi:SHOCT domain-containing protein [Micromonospora citrea]|uniref:SHOCT domain-containing protein n=1 Tax=Micromonospora citrea TaxID=47855 RepID=UPI003C3863AC